MITDIVTDSENREVAERGLNNRIGCGSGGTAESTGECPGEAGTLAGEKAGSDQMSGENSRCSRNFSRRKGRI